MDWLLVSSGIACFVVAVTMVEGLTAGLTLAGVGLLVMGLMYAIIHSAV